MVGTHRIMRGLLTTRSTGLEGPMNIAGRTELVEHGIMFLEFRTALWLEATYQKATTRGLEKGLPDLGDDVLRWVFLSAVRAQVREFEAIRV